jgi:hypothetical protein
MHRKIEKNYWWTTPLWHVVLKEFKTHPTRVNYNDDLFSYGLGLKEKDKGVRKSNVGGWQSDLLDPNKETKPLCDEVFDVLKTLELGIKKIEIPQIWMNINQRGDWNIIHQHGHFHFSGIYYIKYPKDSGRIGFKDPRPAAMSNAFFNERFDGSELKTIDTIQDGSLLLWPSFLEHFVEPSRTDEERMSISFDVIIKE